MLKNILVLLFSLIVYSILGVQNFLLIFFSIATTYIAARCFSSKFKRLIFVITIVLNAGILVALRFLPLFSDLDFSTRVGFWVALGISYYTLQVLSYLVDVYKGKYPAERNPFYYLFYIVYVPHLFMGPISKFGEFKSELLVKRPLTWDNLYAGGLRISWGLLKMLVIARRASVIIATLSENTESYTGGYALLAMFMYSILLYADFSGGIDVVLGISKIIGINLIENFDAPYLSQNIKEFWRRWHISLGRWLKDYIYIPLGGSKRGKIRQLVALLVTFFVSGIWHGLSFIVWGLFHGAFVFVGEKWNTKFKWLNRLITFVIVSFLWSFFIWQDDTMLALRMTSTVFTDFNYPAVWQSILTLGLTSTDWIVLGIFACLVFVFDARKTVIISKIKSMKAETKTALLCTIILLVIVFGVYGFGFDASDFIYGEF